MTNKSSPVDYSSRGLNPYRLLAVQEHAGQQIIDVGCGSGAYVLALAKEYQISGVDYRKFDSWALAPDRFSISDAHSLAYPDNSFDTILSFETLEHLNQPEVALKEYFRVCRKNIIITVPNCELTNGLKSSGIIYNHWIDRSHVNFWTMKELEKLVTSAGFKVCVSKHINHVRLGPALMESLGIGGFFARFGSLVIRLLTRRPHKMTLLIVAEKEH